MKNKQICTEQEYFLFIEHFLKKYNITRQFSFNLTHFKNHLPPSPIKRNHIIPYIHSIYRHSFLLDLFNLAFNWKNTNEGPRFWSEIAIKFQSEFTHKFLPHIK